MFRHTYLQNGTILLAALVTGIMAGFFYAYTFNVNLAMLEVDGETYATMQSLFNQNVRHFTFFILFFGGGAVPLIALAANWRSYRTAPFWLIVVAGVIYITAIIMFTANVNLPLNAYTESWDPQAVPDDWMEVRAAWNRANAFRVFASCTAFTLYLLALVIRASTPVMVSENER